MFYNSRHTSQSPYVKTVKLQVRKQILQVNDIDCPLSCILRRAKNCSYSKSCLERVQSIRKQESGEKRVSFYKKNYCNVIVEFSFFLSVLTISMWWSFLMQLHSKWFLFKTYPDTLLPFPLSNQPGVLAVPSWVMLPYRIPLPPYSVSFKYFKDYYHDSLICCLGKIRNMFSSLIFQYELLLPGSFLLA